MRGVLHTDGLDHPETQGREGHYLGSHSFVKGVRGRENLIYSSRDNKAASRHLSSHPRQLEIGLHR